MFDLSYSGTVLSLAWSLWMGWGIMVPIVLGTVVSFQLEGLGWKVDSNPASPVKEGRDQERHRSLSGVELRETFIRERAEKKKVMRTSGKKCRTVAENTAQIAMDADSFRAELLESPSPVLADFWARWGGRCRVVAPVIEELADNFEGGGNVRRMNVGHNVRGAGGYRVRSIPTLLQPAQGRDDMFSFMRAWSES